MSRWLVLILCLVLLGACGTIAGVGDDISNTARWTRRQL